MGVIPVDPLDIADGQLDLLQDPSYAHVDPLSETQYLFDYATFKLNDPELTVATHFMGVDELKQYAMLVSEIREKFKAKADELFAGEQSLIEGSEPLLDELPKPWTYKGCKGPQDSLRHISQVELK